jgi:hydrogenase maturation factor
MTVLELDATPGLAWCAAAGAAEAELVEVSLLDPVTQGDRILVHAGTAIAGLPAEARA